MSQGQRVIWKYRLEDPESLTLHMRRGSRVLAVAWQQGAPTLWVESPWEFEETEERRFAAVPTGEPFPDVGKYVGSAISDGLVFHIYELSPA